MPIEISGYKVFIASPGGLQEERKAFKAILDEYNKEEALHREVMFQAIGWEDTLPGIGRPQAIINEELKTCDYFIMVLHDRWGSHPGPNEVAATSGTEEEYKIAWKCFKEGASPMKQIVVLFKAVPPNQMSDPGRELQKVIDFRKKIEASRSLLYSTFSTVDEFKKIIQRNISQWLREKDQKVKKTGLINAAENTIVNNSTITKPEPDLEQESTDEDSDPLIDIAWKLADEGKLVEAEVAFSKAFINNPGGSQLLNYSRFLKRIGRIDQAIMMLQQVIDQSDEANDPILISKAFNRMGNVLKTRGDLAGAEKMYNKALSLNEALGRKEGMADQYGNLGNVLKTRGDLDGAEKMYKRSLEIEKALGRKEGMALDYGNLGIVLHIRGDLEGAEKMFNKALSLDEELGSKEGMASNYGNLGIVLKNRGDLDGAEKMYRKALSLNEELGLKEGMANQYGNLGNVLKNRGDLDGAEKMYNRSLEIEKELGRKEGMASDYGSLGIVLKNRGDLDEAEKMCNKALSLYEELGSKEGMANQYENLGIILQARGDLEGAETMYNKAFEIAQSCGFKRIVERVQGFLNKINK